MKIYSFLLFTIFEGVIFFKINKGINVETIKIIRIIAKTNKNIVGLIINISKYGILFLINKE